MVWKFLNIGIDNGDSTMENEDESYKIWKAISPIVEISMPLWAHLI